MINKLFFKFCSNPKHIQDNFIHLQDNFIHQCLFINQLINTLKLDQASTHFQTLKKQYQSLKGSLQYSQIQKLEAFYFINTRQYTDSEICFQNVIKSIECNELDIEKQFYTSLFEARFNLVRLYLQYDMNKASQEVGELIKQKNDMTREQLAKLYTVKGIVETINNLGKDTNAIINFKHSILNYDEPANIYANLHNIAIANYLKRTVQQRKQIFQYEFDDMVQIIQSSRDDEELSEEANEFKNYLFDVYQDDSFMDHSTISDNILSILLSLFGQSSPDINRLMFLQEIDKDRFNEAQIFPVSYTTHIVLAELLLQQKNTREQGKVFLNLFQQLYNDCPLRVRFMYAVYFADVNQNDQCIALLNSIINSDLDYTQDLYKYQAYKVLGVIYKYKDRRKSEEYGRKAKEFKRINQLKSHLSQLKMFMVPDFYHY